MKLKFAQQVKVKHGTDSQCWVDEVAVLRVLNEIKLILCSGPLQNNVTF